MLAAIASVVSTADMMSREYGLLQCIMGQIEALAPSAASRRRRRAGVVVLRGGGDRHGHPGEAMAWHAWLKRLNIPVGGTGMAAVREQAERISRCPYILRNPPRRSSWPGEPERIG